MAGVAAAPILNDALAYMDAIKLQYLDQPYVYNRFIDIMIDFKAVKIDTPGVIKLVTELFRGNDRLLQGFKTFLPPSYLVESVGQNETSIKPKDLKSKI